MPPFLFPYFLALSSKNNGSQNPFATLKDQQFWVAHCVRHGGADESDTNRSVKKSVRIDHTKGLFIHLQIHLSLPVFVML